MSSMLQYIKAVKVAFRDKYGFQPREVFPGDDPIFDEGQIPDGEYPMEIDGRVDNVQIEGGRIHCCRWQ